VQETGSSEGGDLVRLSST